MFKTCCNYFRNAYKYRNRSVNHDGFCLHLIRNEVAGKCLPHEQRRFLKRIVDACEGQLWFSELVARHSRWAWLSKAVETELVANLVLRRTYCGQEESYQEEGCTQEDRQEEGRQEERHQEEGRQEEGRQEEDRQEEDRQEEDGQA
jgi:hypothetical protein